MKKIIRKLTPSFILDLYRAMKAVCAAYFNGFPAEKMIVIGVTGTKGKSSTANFIWAGLREAGIKTGLVGTANLRIADEERLNPYHMTMPDPFVLQGLLKKMTEAGCGAAVLETTSEGIKDFRHLGINYDILVFTNLTPEHIGAHGSFLNYRRAKQVVFSGLEKGRRKVILGKDIPKAVAANADSSESSNFLSFGADKKITYGFDEKADVRAAELVETKYGISYTMGDREIRLKVLGGFNCWNSLAAIAVGRILSLDEEKIIKGLENFSGAPGRMEVAAREPFTVIVDYAHEPESLKALFRAVKAIKTGGKIILLFGATGGRDKIKRPIMGEIAGREADYVVVSNDDPFDEDPKEIIDQVLAGARKAGKKLGADLFAIEDRKEGIRKAVSLAAKGDYVLVAGKGSEQLLIAGDKKIPWDDREIVREILAE